MLIISMLLVVIMMILVIVIILQFHAYRVRNFSLEHIQKQLNSIITRDTSEKLHIVTDDRWLIPVLAEINQLLEQNQQKAANFMKVEQSMRKMVSNISHDLKTPLTVVLGYIEMVYDDPDMKPEDRQMLLSKVYNKANEVLELLRQFFDLARLESGDKRVNLSPVNLNDVCETNMLAFYDTLTMKGFEVVIDIPDKPLFVWGNAEALDRILNNLIDNALRHGGEGMTIGLILSSDDNYAYVEVWDRGRGVSEVHQDRVFERMYTLEDSRNKLFQGSGLGLTITKRLVDIQEGTIDVHSIPYEKTTFTVRLKRIVIAN